jgi:hypothetical protein
VIAAGLFSFRVLLKHLPENENDQSAES